MSYIDGNIAQSFDEYFDEEVACYGLQALTDSTNFNDALDDLQDYIEDNEENEMGYEISRTDNVLSTNFKPGEYGKVRLATPQAALALFEIPKPKSVEPSGLIVALDAIRDPGNLGTIIRLCDWFGIKHLVCSETTVDCFNPKVVQATMGSLTRVNICYVDLGAFLRSSKLSSFGAFMDGDTIYEQDLPQNGILIFGNEANGISERVEALVNHKISIPRFGNLQATESLNVATATAILLSEFCRRK